MSDDTFHLQDLRRRHAAGAAFKYVFFWGHQPAKSGVTSSCLSQWYQAPFEAEGRRYPTAEHFMMAEKAALFGDAAIQSAVLEAPNPGAAKALGRKIAGFDEALWKAQRFDIVVRANLAKFSQNADCAAYLKNTGTRVLVEASPVDKIWGIGLAADDPGAADPARWKGLNLLGFALMEVRARL